MRYWRAPNRALMETVNWAKLMNIIKKTDLKCEYGAKRESTIERRRRKGCENRQISQQRCSLLPLPFKVDDECLTKEALED